MSIDVDLSKLDYEKFINGLMEIEKINNRELLEKIVLEFGNKIGNELVILHNEYYEDGICTWNLFKTIQIAFKLSDKEEDKVSDVFYKLEKELIGYKEVDEACENLGIRIEEG